MCNNIRANRESADIKDTWPFYDELREILGVTVSIPPMYSKEEVLLCQVINKIQVFFFSKVFNFIYYYCCYTNTVM